MTPRDFRRELLNMDKCGIAAGAYISPLDNHPPIRVYADAYGDTYRAYSVFAFYADDFNVAANMAWRCVAALEARRPDEGANPGEGGFIKYLGR